METSQKMDARKLYDRLCPWLRPLGPPYAALMRARRAFYARGLLPSHRPSLPCISVGNIAFGGTGKSPVVGWLLEKAGQSGKRAVVLSRGYGARPGAQALIVGPDTPPELAGDEALMLARRYPQARVVVHPDRAAAARLAESALAPDWLLMDDGMQHLALGRYLNLLLLRPEDLRRDWGRVIPSGPWREGPEALGSASAFLLRCGQDDWPALLPDVEKRLGVFGKPVFSFNLEVSGLSPLASFGPEAAGRGNVPGTDFPGEHAADQGSAPGPSVVPGPSVPGEYAADQDSAGKGSASGPSVPEPAGASLAAPAFAGPYLLMSGVARPGDVEQSATKFLGYAPRHHFIFGDHHAYSAADLADVDARFPEDLPLLCTAKDAVKLAALAGAFGRRSVRVLEAGARFGPSAWCGLSFSAWLDERLAAFG